MHKNFFSLVGPFLLIALIATGVIFYGRGYRLNIGEKKVSPTGILSASSYPDRASIWINGKLTSATSASISLSPGWYDVKISKEGYQSWEKKFRVQGEVVNQADALLLPTNPSLRALTVTGVTTPLKSPSGSKVAYVVPTDEVVSETKFPSKTGVWILDLRSGPLGGKSRPKHIFEPGVNYNWNSSKLYWSPDEKQIIVTFEKDVRGKKTVTSAIQFSTESTTVSVADVSLDYQEILKIWEKEETQLQDLKITTLADSVANILTKSATNISFSPDETKILYLATASATLQPVITPPLIGSNSTDEIRTITVQKYYVYDIKEDKNFQIVDKDLVGNKNKLLWYSDSKHIVIVEKDTIAIVDYDSTNRRAIYNGPFEENTVFPWQSGGNLVILTSLSIPQNLPNLYELDLR